METGDLCVPECVGCSPNSRIRKVFERCYDDSTGHIQKCVDCLRAVRACVPGVGAPPPPPSPRELVAAGAGILAFPPLVLLYQSLKAQFSLQFPGTFSIWKQLLYFFELISRHAQIAQIFSEPGLSCIMTSLTATDSVVRCDWTSGKGPSHGRKHRTDSPPYFGTRLCSLRTRDDGDAITDALPY